MADFWYSVLALFAIIACWELIKYFFQEYVFGNVGDTAATGDRSLPSALKGFVTSDEPHVEMALDPPNGLHLGNPKETYVFENDCCHGEYFLFHPPSVGGNGVGPNGMNYVEYFKGKSRLWETRVQFRFKEIPTPDMDIFFGVELEEYVPLSLPNRQAQSLVTSAIRQAMGGLYQSPGDNPATTEGEIEPPVCVLPLWGFDQFIVTPEGCEPPKLTDPNFSNLGSKRYKRVAEYAREIDELQRNLNTKSTYTLAFWGCSRFLDIINWMVIGIPVATPIDFDRFAGRPPVRVVVYMMPRNEEDKRHLVSRKRYFFRAALWSSRRRPQRHRLEALTGVSGSDLGALAEAAGGTRKSMRRRITSFLKHSIAEPVASSCVAR